MSACVLHMIRFLLVGWCFRENWLLGWIFKTSLGAILANMYCTRHVLWHAGGLDHEDHTCNEACFRTCNSRCWRQISAFFLRVLRLTTLSYIFIRLFSTERYFVVFFFCILSVSQRAFNIMHRTHQRVTIDVDVVHVIWVALVFGPRIHKWL